MKRRLVPGPEYQRLADKLFQVQCLVDPPKAVIRALQKEMARVAVYERVRDVPEVGPRKRVLRRQRSLGEVLTLAEQG